MALLINLRHLEKAPVRLEGELAAEDLELEGVDELIHPDGPLKSELAAEKIEKNILVQGRMSLTLRCECARCLKPFAYGLELADRTLYLPLEGEESAPVANDSVDLTPYIREDILLELPQHPLCEPECGGLPKKSTGKTKKTGGTSRTEPVSSDWSQLNELKF
jgi:uncharacterized protein